MPLSQQEIQQFKIKAQGAGYSPQEIESEIQRKSQESMPTPPPPTQKDDGFKFSDLLPVAGGVLGGIGGSFVAPGVGTVVGGGAGSAAGEALRQFIEGEDADVGKVALEGATGLIPTGKVVGGVGKIAGKALTKTLPERIMGSVFKEGIREAKSGIAKEGESLGAQALARGQVGTTKGLYNAATKQIDNTENTLQEILMSTPHTVSINSIRKTVAPLIKEYKQAGNLPAASALENRLMAIQAEVGESIPASRANQIKRTLYDEAQKAYGTEASAGTEGIKAMARGIKESLEAVPGVKQLNKDLSFYGRQRDSMLDKMTKDEKKNLVGLTDTILSTGGVMAAGPAGVIPAVALKAAGTTIAKTSAAQGLKKAGQLAEQLPAMVGNAASQTVGQSLNRVPSLAMQPGDNSQTDNQSENGLPHSANIAQSEVNSQTPPQQLPSMQTTYVTGYSPEQLGQAYSRAIGDGNTKAATQLKAMYEMETSYQKNNKPSDTQQTAQQLDSTIDEMSKLYGTGTDKSLSQGSESIGIGGGLARLGREKQKATDQKYVNRLTSYNNMRSLAAGIINKARQAGTLNSGEYEVMIQNMPNEYSTESEAKSWFDNAKRLLKNMPANSATPSDSSGQLPAMY